MKTEHFDIIFPEESKPSAMRLYSMAESVYDEVCGKLESRPGGRIPVLITPDIGSFNGGTSLWPYASIVLYDTPLDLGWTSFADNLRGLFLHELTHAVSLRIKAGWANFLSGIFGSWVLPGILNTPEFMAEGATVSFESADGVTGRANDPLVKERLRQDILENRFKTPIEASALYDEYPNGDIYYEYGGLFSSYLQKAYGMEKYAALWRAMGNLVFSFTLDPYGQGFYKTFRKVYGLPFTAAWAGFRTSLALSGVADAPEQLWPAGRETRARMRGGMVSDGERLYWIDSRSNAAMAMDGATLRSRKLFDADATASISDARAAAGGGDAARAGRLLVSRSLYLPDGRDRVETLVYELGEGRFLPATSIAGMREARFFRDGFVGIVPELHNTDLVFSSPAGRRTLLRGSETVMYSQPAVLDERRIALIVSIDGWRKLGILDVDSGRLELARPAEDDGLFVYIRQLSASGGKLYFNFDSDDRLYKLGVLDGSEIRLEAQDYSGGVFWPCEAAGRLFYVGRFSEGEKVCRYPAAADALGERSLGYALEAFDPEPAARASEALAAKVGAEAKVEPYRPLAYASPFNMWFPYLDLAAVDRSFRPFGLFVFQDPTTDNTVNLSLGYDSSYPFADAALAWTSRALPVQLAFQAGDNLVYGLYGAPERQSSASISASLSLPSFPYSRGFALGLGASILGRAEASAAGGTPYAWTYSARGGAASAALAWSGRDYGAAKSASRGLELRSYHDLAFPSLQYKTEGHLVAAYDRVPLRLDIWGAWATAPILRLDSTSPVFASDRRPEYVEYGELDSSSAGALVEGSLGYRLFDQAIHTDILGLYFNRILVDLGYRGAYLNETFHASSFVRASLDLGAALGMAAGQARLFGEGFVRLDPSLSAMQLLGARFGYQTSADAGASARARLALASFEGDE